MEFAVGQTEVNEVRVIIFNLEPKKAKSALV